MSKYLPVTRRNFLKMFGSSFAGLVLTPFANFVPVLDGENSGIGRVTAEVIYIYDRPSMDAKRIGHYHRDKLISLIDLIISSEGPLNNPTWYRVSNGFVHSAYLQRVDDWHFNIPVNVFPTGNILGEVTVPYVQSYIQNKQRAWERVYRLYYHSTYWVTGIEVGPTGTAFYRLQDDWLKVYYYVPATAINLLPQETYEPLLSNGSRDDKRILINLNQQTLTAFENDRVVLYTKVSTGTRRGGDPVGKPTTTPVGSFRIRNKVPSRHMGNGILTDNIYAYEYPGVPWTMFFHKDGYALHGAYWHNNFGTRMSHGCVNMPYEAALWLFRWSSPEFGTGVDYRPGQMYTMGEGTLVQIIEGD